MPEGGVGNAEESIETMQASRLSEGAYCDEHKPLHPDRPSAAKRGYSSKWQRVSKAYLRKHQLCVKCMAEGKYVTATVVDHIVPHRGDHYLMWSDTNWQALCKSCHDRKTGNEVTAYLQAVLGTARSSGLWHRFMNTRVGHELYLKQKPVE